MEDLSPDDRADLDILTDQIALNLLELDEIQNWRHNPTLYVELIGMALFKLGVLQGDRPTGFYVRLAAAGYGFGIAVNSLSTYGTITSNFDIVTTIFWNVPYELGRVAVADDVRIAVAGDGRGIEGGPDHLRRLRHQGRGVGLPGVRPSLAGRTRLERSAAGVADHSHNLGAGHWALLAVTQNHPDGDIFVVPEHRISWDELHVCCDRKEDLHLCLL